MKNVCVYLFAASFLGWRAETKKLVAMIATEEARKSTFTHSEQRVYCGLGAILFVREERWCVERIGATHLPQTKWYCGFYGPIFIMSIIFHSNINNNSSSNENRNQNRMPLQMAIHTDVLSPFLSLTHTHFSNEKYGHARFLNSNCGSGIDAHTERIKKKTPTRHITEGK